MLLSGSEKKKKIQNRRPYQWHESGKPQAVEASRVTAMVLHDVRSPLFYLDKIILQMSRRQDADMSDTCRDQLRTLHESVKTVTGQIQNLFAWLNLVQDGLEVQKKRIQVLPVVEEIAYNYQPLAAGSNTVICCRCEPDLSFVTSPELLHMLLRNLVDNSIKNTVNGKIAIHAERNEKGAVIIVEDNGRGMTTEKTEQLLGTSHSGGLSGLGYRYIRDILHLLQASIDIKSIPGAGTRVILCFPEHAG